MVVYLTHHRDNRPGDDRNTFSAANAGASGRDRSNSDDACGAPDRDRGSPERGNSAASVAEAVGAHRAHQADANSRTSHGTSHTGAASPRHDASPRDGSLPRGERDPTQASRPWEAAVAGENKSPQRGFWMFKSQADAFYQNVHTQIFVAALIIVNFLTNMLEKQLVVDRNPSRAQYEPHFSRVEAFFNIIFAFELLINMYSTWLWGFWKSGWNRFDFVVVVVGLLSTFNVPMPGPLSKLRMMRAFRIFRLFKRAPSLNKIIVSLITAIPGVFNAFFIMILVMSIYAIVAVELFMEQGFSCDPSCRGAPETCAFPVTARSLCVGPELFGTFFRAFYSLFQVLTNESWSEAVTRPLLRIGKPSTPGDLFDIAIALYFVSFVIVNSVVLINVVVAVLLEKMVDSGQPVSMEDIDLMTTDSANDADGYVDDLLPGDCLPDGDADCEDALMTSAWQDVLELQRDLEGLHAEVAAMSAELSIGLERARADVLVMRRKLDEVLRLVNELIDAPVNAKRCL